ncbi:MAG: hypothetical protein ACLT98_03355 [Eggerthellaceae bacterium]
MQLMMGGDVAAEVNPALVSTWISFDENLTPSLDEEALIAWAKQLEAACDTVGTERTYTRPDGKVITVAGGPYGWLTDGEALLELVKEGVANGTVGAVDIPCKPPAPATAQAQDWSARYCDIDLSSSTCASTMKPALIWKPCVSGAERRAQHPHGRVLAQPESKPVGTERHEPTARSTNRVRYWMPPSATSSACTTPTGKLRSAAHCTSRAAAVRLREPPRRIGRRPLRHHPVRRRRGLPLVGASAECRKRSRFCKFFDFVARLTMNDQGFLINASRCFVIPSFRKSKMPDEGFGLSRKLATKSKNLQNRLGNRPAGSNADARWRIAARRSARVHRRSMPGSPPRNPISPIARNETAPPTEGVPVGGLGHSAPERRGRGSAYLENVDPRMRRRMVSTICWAVPNSTGRGAIA